MKKILNNVVVDSANGRIISFKTKCKEMRKDFDENPIHFEDYFCDFLDANFSLTEIFRMTEQEKEDAINFFIKENLRENLAWWTTGDVCEFFDYLEIEDGLI